MTLDKAEVCLDGVFEEAQVYVSLSRVRSLKGLTITGLKANVKAIRANAAALQFYEKIEQERVMRDEQSALRRLDRCV
jgi:hypothetical protein